MRARGILAAGCWAVIAMPAGAEIIDRIAVTVGNQVITESMVFEQIRLAAFVDGREPVLEGPAKRAAAESLVSQALLVEEMDNTRYPEPAMIEAIAWRDQQLLPRFSGEAGYRQALERYRLTDEDVRRFVQRMLRSVAFIDLRFRRGQQVSSAEVSSYYLGKFQENWKQLTPDRPVPPLDEVADAIEEQLLNEKTDKATEEWLEQARARARIRFREEVFP